MNRTRIISVFLIIAFSLVVNAITQTVEASTVVKDLKVEYLKNPVGIDVTQPRFSWKMESDKRGVTQTAYQIIVSTDRLGENTIWDSGKTESAQSVHIKYAGTALSPSTRYYWQVHVWDNNDTKITSNEDSFFETGLLSSGWSNAKWIKAPLQSDAENAQWAGITKYFLEMDFEIKSEGVGPIFGATDEHNYYMWQVNIGKETGKTYLRPHSWRNGGANCHAEIDITSKINVLKNTVYQLKIEVDGKTAKTYIDGILVDTRQNPFNANYGFGKIGFRASSGTEDEDGYFDNVKVAVDKNGTDEVVFSEDFSNAADFGFTYGTVENGRLFVKGAVTAPLAWQKSDVANSAKFDLEMDVTLIRDAAGIIFATENSKCFYMWSIIVSDNSNDPTLRRHYFKNGNAQTSNVNIGAFVQKSDLINWECKVKIAVDAGIVKTYINNTLVDTYTDEYGSLLSGAIGFRAYNGYGTDEVAYYDNIKYTEYTDNQPATRLDEDFESNNMTFEKGERITVNGNTKLKVSASGSTTLLFDESLSGINMFRTEFNANKQIQSARIYSSALGIYDLFINGRRVGTINEDNNTIYDELKPGWTDYNKTVFYSTYDVTSYVKQGQNAIGAHVSSGWWRGDVAHGEYGDPPLAFIAKLIVTYTDGTSDIVVTQPATWLTSNDSPIRLGEIYDGESYDARKESNWTEGGFNTSGWNNTIESADFKGQIKAFVGPPVQVRPELQRTPVKITRYDGITQNGTSYGTVNVKQTYDSPASVSLKKGETVVYDMGQNMVGWVRFKVKGNAGIKMKIRFAEMLNDTGESSRANDDAGGSLYTAALRGARATLYYTLKGDSEGETFSPSTTFFGFRYCDIIATGDIEIEWLTGEVVGTIAAEGSTLTTSNAAVNQLYSNIVWGQRGNFVSIPTDCPQRDERLGWTGDIQVFGHAAIYNADLSAFFHKWMGDMRDSQRSDGAYPDVAPHSWVGWGQAAWAEAGIVVPWIVYLMYGNTGILEENFKSMEQYMAFLKNQAGDGYLYNGAGTAYGDWVAPVSTDSRYVSVCYYAYSALLMEKAANALSKAANDSYAIKAKSYHSLYEKIKAEFQQRYVNTNGTLKEKTQTAYLLALKLDLFPDEESKQKAVTSLRSAIVSNGNKLNTGFVGTGIINQTLSEVGLTDIAYNLLLQRNNPSWLYSVDQGATTVWERWDSYKKESGFNPIIGMNSFNHYAYGAVSEWMYRYMAGINPDETQAGFKHINITPKADFRTSRPAGQEKMTSVDATYDSYYGKVRSAWEVAADGNMKYTVSIPANTTATVTLPLTAGDKVIYESNKPLSKSEGVVSYTVVDKEVIIEIQSGTYVFDFHDDEGLSVKQADDTGKFSIYPNPVHDRLNITSDETITKIELYNTFGIQVYAQNTNAPVEMSHFPAGVYFVHIYADNKLSGTIKVIKE